MPWTAAQYVARVLVTVARQTGRAVADIAGESFALTLWTWGELMAMDREAAVERMGERTDLAGLVAVAFHEPTKLHAAELRYMKAAGTLTRALDAQRARLATLAQQYAKAVPDVPVPG